MGTRAETTKKEKAILKFIETQVLENGYQHQYKAWKYNCNSESWIRQNSFHQKQR